MNDSMSQIFGYLVLAAAAVLIGWEALSYMNRRREDAWLITKSRLQRRIIMGALLALVGLVVVIESYGVLDLRQFNHLVTYVLTLTAIAVTLMVLAIRDLAEMARNAERHAVEDLQKSLQDRAGGSSGQSE